MAQHMISHVLNKKREQEPKSGNLFSFSVVLEGFEPPQAEPESDVLPLHHKTISLLNSGVSSSEHPALSFNGCKVTQYF